MSDREKKEKKFYAKPAEVTVTRYPFHVIYEAYSPEDHGSNGVAYLFTALEAERLCFILNSHKDLLGALKILAHDYRYLLEEKMTPQDAAFIDAAIDKAEGRAK